MSAEHDPWQPPAQGSRALTNAELVAIFESIPEHRRSSFVMALSDDAAQRLLRAITAVEVKDQRRQLRRLQERARGE